MRSRAVRLLLASSMVLPALLVTNTGTGWSEEPELPPITHPERDHAGSTIAAHEGYREQAGPRPAPSGVPGIDASHHQGAIDWQKVSTENRFAYVKATEGTGYTDPKFNRNYRGSYRAGMYRGAYHFALPDRSSGAKQAKFFVRNGGGWSADGKTLPPMLDIEYNPYGETCYGKSHSAMVRWISAFHDEVHRLTGRYPTIYTTRNWWRQCTGDTGKFSGTSPLFVACYCDDPYPLPDWPSYTFWQYTSTGTTPGVRGRVDKDVFNGDRDKLAKLARG